MVSSDRVVEKVHFSCMGDDGFARRFREIDRSQAVLVGIEAHVCVLQTAEQLIEAGCDVFVVADATSSRTTANHEAALERMRADGAQIVTTEMVTFEWLERAGTPEFKKISALIK
jgi:nicotinamidase-related amidase